MSYSLIFVVSMDYKDKRTKRARKYFAVMRELGYSGIDAKNKAKKSFKVGSFTELSALNLDELIEQAELEKLSKDYEKQNGYRK